MPNQETSAQNPVSQASTTVAGQPSTLNMNWETIQNNISIMLAYASKRGIQLPQSLKLGQEQDHAELVESYNALITAVAPATPASIQYINKSMTKHDKILKWYEFSILTKCLILAVLALIVIIGISLFPAVNEKNQASGLLNSSGWELLYNLIFVCSASLMGVMFYLLKTISSKIKNYTLTEVDAIEINGAIIIGVISGFIIAELFTFTISQFAGDKVEIHKMTLALLGGFSSDAIFTIIQNFVNTIKSLFSSKT